MEYTVQQGTMKKPSEDSVQEMLELIQRQQTVAAVGDDTSVGFRGRVFDPLPAIGTKVTTKYDTLASVKEDDTNNSSNFGENKRKHTVEDELTTQPKLERESTFFDLKSKQSTGLKGTPRNSDNLDFTSRRVDYPVTTKSTKAVTTPRPFPLRRESTNYHLPPLPEPQFPNPKDIERPSAPSPDDEDFFVVSRDGNFVDEERPGSQFLFNDAYESKLENMDSNGGDHPQMLSPWPGAQETNNSNDEWRWEEKEEVYERPKTARGRRRRDEQPVRTPETPNSKNAIERPKSSKGRRRMKAEDTIETRPTTARGRRREVSEQEAYEPYERPRTARGRRSSEAEGTLERPKTARGRGRRRNAPEEHAEKERPGKARNRPRSPGPHHPRYTMMNTNSVSNREIDDNVAVMTNTAR